VKTEKRGQLLYIYAAQFMEERRWMPGTVLQIPCDVPPFFHLLMVEFTDYYTGAQCAIHNMPVTGVTRAPLNDIIKGKAVSVPWTPQTPRQAEAAVQRMQSLLGHPYMLVEANCEHPVWWAVTGKWQSEQVSAVAEGLLVFGVGAGAVAIAASI
jgi:hypothetical protein